MIKSQESILVVDDEILIQMDLEMMLEDAGYCVHACSSLAKARSALERGHFNAVVTDGCMEAAEDGRNLLAFIRKQYPAMPVIGYSAQPHGYWQAENDPMFVALAKPSGCESILSSLHHLMTANVVREVA